DILEPLQRIITVLPGPFSRADDLPFIRDVDALVLIHPHPAEHLVIKDEEPVEFGSDIRSIAKCDPVVADLGFQLEGLFRRDIDLRDLCRPKAVTPDKGTQLQDARGEHAIGAGCMDLCCRVPGKYRQMRRKFVRQWQLHRTAIDIETVTARGKQTGYGFAFADPDL